MAASYLEHRPRTHAQFIAERTKPRYRVLYNQGLYAVALTHRTEDGAFTVDRYISTHATLEEARAAMPDATE